GAWVGHVPGKTWTPLDLSDGLLIGPPIYAFVVVLLAMEFLLPFPNLSGLPWISDPRIRTERDRAAGAEYRRFTRASLVIACLSGIGAFLRALLLWLARAAVGLVQRDLVGGWPGALLGGALGILAFLGLFKVLAWWTARREG